MIHFANGWAAYFRKMKEGKS